MDVSTEVPIEVSKAIAGVERSMTRLLSLLKSPEPAVQAGALASSPLVTCPWG